MQEELREFRERFFAEVAAAVEIVAPFGIAIHQMLLILSGVPREPARDRPDAAGVERFQQACVRHEPRHAAVPVGKRVNPQQPMMRRSRGEDGFRTAEPAIDLFKARHETRHRARADREVTSDLDIVAGGTRRQRP